KISIHDNFFEIGGHSLLIVQLSERINSIFKQRLSLSTFYTHPSIESLAPLLQDDIHISSDILVALKPSGEKPPLFLIHPIGGHLMGYQTLCDKLPEIIPLYGLEQDEYSDSIETMASRYINAIQTVQPTGPYQLLGWSMGGMIAHEMAYQ